MEEAKKHLEKMLGQAGSILQRIKNEKEKKIEGDVPQEIKEKLDDLEKQIESFISFENFYIEETEKTKKEIEKTLGEPVVWRKEEDEKMIAYGEKIARAAKILEKAVQKAVEKKALPDVKKEQLEKKMKQKKEKQKERRKKFKRIGGDDKWIPL